MTMTLVTFLRQVPLRLCEKDGMISARIFVCTTLCGGGCCAFVDCATSLRMDIFFKRPKSVECERHKQSRRKISTRKMPCVVDMLHMEKNVPAT